MLKTLYSLDIASVWYRNSSEAFELYNVSVKDTMYRKKYVEMTNFWYLFIPWSD